VGPSHERCLGKQKRSVATTLRNGGALSSDFF
jgi:hypothetical protein